MTPEERRAARRAAMPIVSGFVEELEAQGLAPTVIYATENGITVGKRPEYRNVFDIPKGYGMETSTAPFRKGARHA